MDVKESEFTIEQPAVPALLTAKETVPVSEPPEVVNRKFVKNGVDVEVKVSVAWAALETVKVTLFEEVASK